MKYKICVKFLSSVTGLHRSSYGGFLERSPDELTNRNDMPVTDRSEIYMDTQIHLIVGPTPETPLGWARNTVCNYTSALVINNMIFEEHRLPIARNRRADGCR